MGNYSIKKTDSRERRFEYLENATGEGTTSGAIDVASTYYLKMAGDNQAFPTGRVHDLMDLACEEGSVTPEQIADVLGAGELPIEYEHDWSVGEE